MKDKISSNVHPQRGSLKKHTHFGFVTAKPNLNFSLKGQFNSLKIEISIFEISIN